MLAPVSAQRMEGLVLLVAGVAGFGASGHSWWWFAGLLLVPDLTMVGYLGNPRLGATIYNAGHSLIGPGLIFGGWWLGGPDWLLAVAWIWIAHIGMDRLFGFGLKFGDDFSHTHLGWIGNRGPDGM